MFYKEATSIPRIHVVRDKGKIVCALDEKLQQRYGSVLLKNNKQGRHLFSISYCLVSMALKYTDMPERQIVSDILTRFHFEFLTILMLNSKSEGTDTTFFNNWEANYDTLARAFDHLRRDQHESLDVHVLENYLNIVGVMLHTLPCNVAFSDNASDPAGGARTKKAIENLNKIADWECSPMQVNENIALVIDHGVVDEIFGKGFNAGNIWLLAFMIIQIRELQSLQRKGRSSDLYLGLDNAKIEREVFEIAFASKTSVPRNAAFSDAILHATDLIGLLKKELRLSLNSVKYHWAIKQSITIELDKTYGFTYSAGK